MTDIDELKSQSKATKYSRKGYSSDYANERREARNRLATLAREEEGETLLDVGEHLEALATDSDYPDDEQAHARTLLYALATEYSVEELGACAIKAHQRAIGISEIPSQHLELVKQYQDLIAVPIEDLIDATKRQKYSHRGYSSYYSDLRETARNALVEVGEAVGGETLETVASHLHELAIDTDYPDAERDHTRALLFQLAVSEHREIVSSDAASAISTDLSTEKHRDQLATLAETYESIIQQAVVSFESATQLVKYSHKGYSRDHRKTREGAREKLVDLGTSAGGEILRRVATHLQELATDDDYPDDEQQHARELLFELAVNSDREDLIRPSIIAEKAALDESDSRKRLAELGSTRQSLVGEAVSGFKSATQSVKYSHKGYSRDHRKTREDARKKLVQLGIEAPEVDVSSVASHLRELAEDTEYPVDERTHAVTCLQELATARPCEETVAPFLEYVEEEFSRSDPPLDHIVDSLCKMLDSVEGEYCRKVSGYLLQTSTHESIEEDTREKALRSYTMFRARIDSNSSPRDFPTEAYAIHTFYLESEWGEELPDPRVEITDGREETLVSIQDGSDLMVCFDATNEGSASLTIAHERFHPTEVEIDCWEHYQEQTVQLEAERGSVSLLGTVSGTPAPEMEFTLAPDEFLSRVGVDETRVMQSAGSDAVIAPATAELPDGTYQVHSSFVSEQPCFSTETAEVLVEYDELTEQEIQATYTYSLPHNAEETIDALERQLDEREMATDLDYYTRLLLRETIDRVRTVPDTWEWVLRYETDPGTLVEELLRVAEVLLDCIGSVSWIDDDGIRQYDTCLSDRQLDPSKAEIARRLLVDTVDRPQFVLQLVFNQATESSVVLRSAFRETDLEQNSVNVVRRRAIVQLTGATICNQTRDTTVENPNALIQSLQSIGRLEDIAVPIFELGAASPGKTDAALTTVLDCLGRTEARLSTEVRSRALETLDAIARETPQVLLEHVDQLEERILESQTGNRLNIHPDRPDEASVGQTCIEALLHAASADPSSVAETLQSLERHGAWGISRQIAGAAQTSEWAEYRRTVLNLFEEIAEDNPSLIRTSIDPLEQLVREDGRQEIHTSFAWIIVYTASQISLTTGDNGEGITSLLFEAVSEVDEPELAVSSFRALSQLVDVDDESILEEQIQSIVERISELLAALEGGNPPDQRVVDAGLELLARLAADYPDLIISTIDLHQLTVDQAYQRGATAVLANLAGERADGVAELIAYFGYILDGKLREVESEDAIEAPYVTKAYANLARSHTYRDEVAQRSDQFRELLRHGDEQTKLYTISVFTQLFEGETDIASAEVTEDLEAVRSKSEGELRDHASHALQAAGELGGPTSSDKDQYEPHVPINHTNLDRLSDLAHRLSQNLLFSVEERVCWETVNAVKIELEKHQDEIQAEVGGEEYRQTRSEVAALLQSHLDKHNTQNLRTSDRQHAAVFSLIPMLSEKLKRYAVLAGTTEK